MKTIEVVAAIIQKNDTFFATQRGYGDFMGGWEFPGGKVEVQENHKEALKREIQEELSMNIDVQDLFCTVNYTYPKFQIVMHCYLATFEGDFRLNEHLSYKWLSVEQLDSVDWLPADIEVVNKLKVMSM